MCHTQKIFVNGKSEWCDIFHFCKKFIGITQGHKSHQLKYQDDVLRIQQCFYFMRLVLLWIRVIFLFLTPSLLCSCSCSSSLPFFFYIAIARASFLPYIPFAVLLVEQQTLNQSYFAYKVGCEENRMPDASKMEKTNLNTKVHGYKVLQKRHFVHWTVTKMTIERLSYIGYDFLHQQHFFPATIHLVHQPSN